MANFHKADIKVAFEINCLSFKAQPERVSILKLYLTFAQLNSYQKDNFNTLLLHICNFIDNYIAL